MVAKLTIIIQNIQLLHNHKILISEKVANICCFYGVKVITYYYIFAAICLYELTFYTDVHKAVLHRIQEVLAAANCTVP